jgi:hypothetical protein
MNFIIFKYFLLNLVCKVYDASVTAGTPPHLVMDLTTSGLSSEVIKAITRNLGLPTVSGSFGEVNGIK